MIFRRYHSIWFQFDKIVQVPPFHRSIRLLLHRNFKWKKKFSIWRIFFNFWVEFEVTLYIVCKMFTQYVRWYLLNSFYIKSWIFQREHVANLYSGNDVYMYEGFVGSWEFIRKYHGKTRADRFKNCIYTSASFIDLHRDCIVAGLKKERKIFWWAYELTSIREGDILSTGEGVFSRSSLNWI